MNDNIAMEHTDQAKRGENVRGVITGRRDQVGQKKEALRMEIMEYLDAYGSAAYTGKIADSIIRDLPTMKPDSTSSFTDEPAALSILIRMSFDKIYRIEVM